MANLIDDTINFSFGLFAYSREKIEQLVEKMVDMGKVERKDAQSFTHDLIEKGDDQRKEIKHMIAEELRSALQEIGLTNDNRLTKDDIRAVVREEISAAGKQD